MRFLNIIRSSEWWEYKIPPFLALGYATALMAGVSFLELGIWFLFLLLCIALGAVFVSVINDITDLEEDIASGKHNRMERVPQKLRWAIPVLCILIGFLFIYIFYPDQISILLFIMPCVAFSLYSFEPIRLKRRGILGVLADASGSHVFTSLLIVSSTSFFIGQPIDLIWFASVGCWAVIYGMRGILWHQFFDRNNDLKINLNTYATNVDPSAFRNKERLLFTVELLLLGFILIQIGSLLPFVFLIMYLGVVYIRHRGLRYQVCIILSPSDKPFQLIMLDYYQVFLPVSLIVASIFTFPADIFVLIIHLVLFPNSVIKVLKDSVGFLYKRMSYKFFP